MATSSSHNPAAAFAPLLDGALGRCRVVAQDLRNRGVQLGGGEGFGQKGARQIEGVIGKTGDEENRESWIVRGEPVRQGLAVHTRHPKVGDYQVRRCAHPLQDGDGGQPVCGGYDVVPRIGERPRNDEPDRQGIVDDQYLQASEKSRQGH
jgi:hypothetical protein